MNKQRSIALVRRRFTNLTSTSKDIIRVEHYHRKALLRILYFDFSQSVGRDDFDLMEYLQKNITRDFYRHDGSLQWNFYLYFVVDKELLQKLQKTGRAVEIEADRRFARKYVRDDGWLKHELSQPFVSQVYGLTPPKDITADWMERLTEAGLATICDSDTPYRKIVEHHIQGKSPTGRKRARTPRTISTLEAGKVIDYLQIERFRDYPLEKRYNFGTVNLIRGVNGSGKTSLLEAIELAICGGIRRQGNKRPRAASLYIQYHGEDTTQKAPLSNLSKYRQLDRAWYGGYYRTVNKLPENFGRFNFFDSDAGFRLSQGKSAGDIKMAIEALFLGEHANALEKTMSRCREMFQRKEKEFFVQLQARKESAARLETDIRTVRRIKYTREALLDELKAKAESIGWKTLPSMFELDELVALREAVEDLFSQLGYSLRHLSWMRSVSVHSLKQEASKIATSLQNIQANQESRAELEKAHKDASSELTSTESKSKVIDRLMDFHAETEAFLLKGTEEALKKHNTRLEQLKAASSIVREIDTSPFAQSAATLDILSSDIETDFKKRRKELNQKRKRIAQLREEFGELKTLVEEIRQLGRRFCEMKHGTDECPLCGAQHEMGLLSAIAAQKTARTVDASMRNMMAEASRDQKRLSTLKKSRNDLSRLVEAASHILPARKLKSKATRSIVNAFSTIAEQIDAERLVIGELVARRKRLKILGYTEAELRQLLSEAKKICGMPISKLSNPEVLRDVAASQLLRCKALRKELANSENGLNQKSLEARGILAKVLGESDVTDPIPQLNRRRTSVSQALDTSSRSEKSLSFPSKEDFHVLKGWLKAFSKTVERTQKGLSQLEERDRLEKDWISSLDKIRVNIADLKAKHLRARQAVEVLSGLLESEGKDMYLSEMISQQRAKLVAIFRRIHSPNEFIDVNLDGELRLERRNGEEADLTSISTGQRCALAISIFLSMNSSIGQNAPWLIFDDPVVQVDDLNVLSFLDALRELVIDGKRQVFFSTANNRIANLFARKFDFLGNAFKEFALDRADV